MKKIIDRDAMIRDFIERAPDNLCAFAMLGIDEVGRVAVMFEGANNEGVVMAAHFEHSCMQRILNKANQEDVS